MAMATTAFCAKGIVLGGNCAPRSRPVTQKQPWRCCRGKNIKLTAPSGRVVDAWMSTPSDNFVPATGRGILVLTDVFGYKNEDTRQFAESLVDHGMSIIIPDLFRGRPWTPDRAREEYEEWRAQHPMHRVLGDARLAAAQLRRLGLSVGILGFCFGGGRAMEEMSFREAGIDPDAAVVYYPTRFDAFHAGRLVRCPLMVVFGEKDKEIPATQMRELQKGLDENQDLGACKFVVYEGAGHGFAHHPASKQDEDDSEILKCQTAEWFSEHLPGEQVMNDD